jgi:hypothetical protein
VGGEMKISRRFRIALKCAAVLLIVILFVVAVRSESTVYLCSGLIEQAEINGTTVQLFQGHLLANDPGKIVSEPPFQGLAGGVCYAVSPR